MSSFPSIRIEGGLLGPELLDQVIAADVPGQKLRLFCCTRASTDQVFARTNLGQFRAVSSLPRGGHRHPSVFDLGLGAFYKAVVLKQPSRRIGAGFAGAVGWALMPLLYGALGSLAGPKDFLVDGWRFDDDLPRDGINSIAQSSDGYLWVSSRYGLARFDGVRFADFSSQVGAQFLGYHYANLMR